jgi:nucleotide-binding universal stress UspA family protein
MQSITPDRLRGVPPSIHQTECPWIVVPVDGSPSGERALDMGSSLARRHGYALVLAGVLRDAPPTCAYDAAEVEALLLAAELGMGTPFPPLRLDLEPDEERIARTLWRVLLPLQHRLEAAGLTASLRVLNREDPAGALFALLDEAPRRSAVALGSPLELTGPLREISARLITRPPCTLYVTGLTGSTPSHRFGLIAGLLRRIWQPRGC